MIKLSGGGHQGAGRVCLPEWVRELRSKKQRNQFGSKNIKFEKESPKNFLGLGFDKIYQGDSGKHQSFKNFMPSRQRKVENSKKTYLNHLQKLQPVQQFLPSQNIRVSGLD